MVYRPTARVLTVLELLRAQERMTGAALAARLEVDIRTVRHYVEMLRDLGIPVVAERGRHGAYRGNWNSGSTRPQTTPNFSPACRRPVSPTPTAA